MLSTIYTLSQTVFARVAIAVVLVMTILLGYAQYRVSSLKKEVKELTTSLEVLELKNKAQSLVIENLSADKEQLEKEVTEAKKKADRKQSQAVKRGNDIAATKNLDLSKKRELRKEFLERLNEN